MMIIGITGTTGAGKSEVAKYIARKYGAKHLSVRGFLESKLSPNASEKEI
jgi:dephospho-CoA kinase